MTEPNDDVPQKRRSRAPQILPAVLGRQDAANYIGVGLTTLDELVKHGELIARKINAKTVFVREELDEWIERLPKASYR